MPQSPSSRERASALAQRVVRTDALIVLRTFMREGRDVSPATYHLVLALSFMSEHERQRLRCWEWAGLVDALAMYETDDGRVELLRLAGWETAEESQLAPMLADPSAGPRCMNSLCEHPRVCHAVGLPGQPCRVAGCTCFEYVAPAVVRVVIPCQRGCGAEVYLDPERGLYLEVAGQRPNGPTTDVHHTTERCRHWSRITAATSPPRHSDPTASGGAYPHFNSYGRRW